VRIVHLSVGDPFTARLVNAQVRGGHEVHLIMLVKESENIKNVHLHYLPYKPPIGYVVNVFALRKLLRKIQPDIFHVHYASGHGLLGRLSGFRPSILSAWGSDVMIVPKQSRVMYWIVKRNLEYYDSLIATSKAMIDDINKTFRFHRTIHQIPIGIELEKFANPKTKNNNKPIVIGTVKTMKHIYGIDTLLRSFKLLTNIYKAPLKLLIVGDGPDMGALKKLSSELGIDKSVDFIGYIKNEYIPSYLAKMDIFVNLSRIESFGVAVLEASAMELPVVTTNVGGLPEVVIEGVTGFMVDTNDYETCSDYLYKLVVNNLLRNSMGKNGRRFVSKRYQWPDSYKLVLDKYDGLLK
jgi:L-malate glycosyltransferase